MMRSLALVLLAASFTLPLQANDLRQAEGVVTQQCSRCHGLGGESIDPFFPRLTGQYQEYLERQLQDFKSGKRKSDVMVHQVGSLSAEDMHLISVFLEAGFSTSEGVTKNHDIALPTLGAGKLQKMQTVQQNKNTQPTNPKKNNNENKLNNTQKKTS